METYAPKRLSILPNNKTVGLPDIKRSIAAQNNYDRHLLSRRKKGDEIVLS